MRPMILKKLGFLLLSVPALLATTGEKDFFGVWTPPASLQSFWKPIDEFWWKIGEGVTPKLERHCRQFADRSKPREIIPAMINDLKQAPSEVRWFVYLHVMQHWRRSEVLKVLSPFQRSGDADVRHIADEFYADLEEPKAAR